MTRRRRLSQLAICVTLLIHNLVLCEHPFRRTCATEVELNDESNLNDCKIIVVIIFHSRILHGVLIISDELLKQNVNFSNFKNGSLSFVSLGTICNHLINTYPYHMIRTFLLNKNPY